MNKLIKFSFAFTLSFSTLLYDSPCQTPCLKDTICHQGQCIHIPKQKLVTNNCHAFNYCSSQQSCISGVCISINRTIECDKCQAGQNCFYGKCVPGPINQNYEIAPCIPSCSSNYQCSLGQCVAKVQRCRGNGDCKFNEVCRSRKCVKEEENKPCRFACLKGYQCKYGNCIPIVNVGGCGFDSDCGINEICLDHICVDKDSLGCSQDCPSGFTCSKGQCVWNSLQSRGCQDRSQCINQESCIQGRCVLGLSSVRRIKE